MDELIQMLFISQCGGCVWLFSKRLSLHCHHCWNTPPVSHCAHINCLIYLNIQQALMNVKVCNFFPYGVIQFLPFATYIFPCQTPICLGTSLLPSVAWQQSVMEYWGQVQPVLPYITSDVMGQHEKRGGITYWAAFIYTLLHGDLLLVWFEQSISFYLTICLRYVFWSLEWEGILRFQQHGFFPANINF